MDIQPKPLAIVSGGTGYLGTAIVAGLKATGWNVASLSRTGSDVEAGLYQCDVTDEADVHAVLTRIVASYGPVSACIHAAAPSLDRAPILSTSIASFNMTMDTAVRGAFLLAKEVVGHMQKDAAFIGITTQAIEPGTPQPSGAYVPAKYALRGFLRVLSTETKEQGLRVYAIAPSFLPGGLNNDLPQKIQEFLAGKSDTNSESPREIAKLIAELCTGATQIPSGSSVAFPSLAVSSL